MKLENQVCSLELSKRLKELGVKQESLFYTNPDSGTIIYSPNTPLFHPESNTIWISAFTVADIGKMLPCYSYEIIKSLRWIDFSCEYFQKSFKCATEADARAKMLIYLLENKLMELPNE